MNAEEDDARDWTDFLSSVPLLWTALLSAIALLVLMVSLLRARVCSDWYMMLFTTTAAFNLFVLFPFVQSSRLAPGDVTDDFADIDRPWMLVLVYAFSALVISSVLTCIFELATAIQPRFKKNMAYRVARGAGVAGQVLLPVADVLVEWTRQTHSPHCSDGFCRWSAARKDAILCLQLLLWSVCVAATLLCANLDDVMRLPHYASERRIKRAREEQEAAARVAADELALEERKRQEAASLATATYAPKRPWSAAAPSSSEQKTPLLEPPQYNGPPPYETEGRAVQPRERTSMTAATVADQSATSTSTSASMTSMTSRTSMTSPNSRRRNEQRRLSSSKSTSSTRKRSANSGRPKEAESKQ